MNVAFHAENSKPIQLDGSLTCARLMEAASRKYGVVLAEGASERIRKCHAIVQDIAASGIKGYGITTGVGSQKDFAVPAGAMRDYNRPLGGVQFFNLGHLAASLVSSMSLTPRSYSPPFVGFPNTRDSGCLNCRSCHNRNKWELPRQPHPACRVTVEKTGAPDDAKMSTTMSLSVVAACFGWLAELPEGNNYRRLFNIFVQPEETRRIEAGFGQAPQAAVFFCADGVIRDILAGIGLPLRQLPI